MKEFILICAVLGLFALYMLCTLIPTAITYHFIKDTHLDKPHDMPAAFKSLLVAYAIGLLAFVYVVTFFGFMRY